MPSGFEGELPRTSAGSGRWREADGFGEGDLGLQAPVVVDLGDPPLADPIPLYCPVRQPLPNSPHFGDHLLDQCRRLVLAQAGLTVVLVDDPALRLGLASGLAAGPMKRTITQKSTREPMPIQAPWVVTATNRSAWLRLRGSQLTSRGEVSTGAFTTGRGRGGNPWDSRRLASPMERSNGCAEARGGRDQGRPIGAD